MVILEAANVTLSYGAHRVLTDVSVRIERGCRTVLIGSNGSGKTTLLRALCGSHRPELGEIRLAQEPLSYGRAGLRAHRRRVQLVLQDPDDQLFSADVAQDVSFGPTNLGLGEEEVLGRVAEALDLLSITHLAGRPCHQLSFGERKRVALAGAIAMRPQVLLLDEPTAGLDPVGVQEMLQTLDRLRDLGTTLVFSTHELDLALAIADQAAVVHDGRVTVGDPVALLGDEELLAAARLRRPTMLEVAAQLGLAERPRTVAELVAALRRS